MDIFLEKPFSSLFVAPSNDMSLPLFLDRGLKA